MNNNLENTHNNTNNNTNIEDINVNTLRICRSGKNYYNITDDKNTQICVNEIYSHIPFGIERFNNKIILNIELITSNESNNIVSKIENLEKYISTKLPNLGLTTCVKKSKLGHIIRGHYMKNTECYILKKNGEKMNVDESNLQLSDCKINIIIKGIWTTDNNCGLYVGINSINIVKFN